MNAHPAPGLTRVFVYGSLLSDLHNHQHHLGRAVSVGPARTARGWALFSCGAFPAMVERISDERVVGELYDVTAAELARLDRLEGIDADDPERGHYQRVRVAVFVADRPTPLSACTYVQSPRRMSHRELVPGGDWRAFVAEQHRGRSTSPVTERWRRSVLADDDLDDLRAWLSRLS